LTRLPLIETIPDPPLSFRIDRSGKARTRASFHAEESSESLAVSKNNPLRSLGNCANFQRAGVGGRRLVERGVGDADDANDRRIIGTAEATQREMTMKKAPVPRAFAILLQRRKLASLIGLSASAFRSRRFLRSSSACMCPRKLTLLAAARA